MKAAKVFKSGNSQAVRLPKEFQLDVKEVGIFRQGGDLILRPMKKTWQGYFCHGSKFTADYPDQIDDITVLDWPFEAGEIYGRIRADLKGKGTPIGAMDLLIAAHALFLDAALVTGNEREFQRVSDLKIEKLGVLRVGVLLIADC